jgi:NADH-quinone oxidoreductase subunit G
MNTKLDDVATKTYHAAPDDIARLGFAVAHELNPDAPAVSGISDAELTKNPPPSPFSKGGRESTSPPFNKGGAGGISPDGILPLAREIAQTLKNAKRPLIVSGTGCLSEAVIQAAANVAGALYATGKQAELCYAVHECNTMGLGLMAGKNLNEGFKAVQDDKADTVIVLENDLYRRADRRSIDDFLSKANFVIVIDHLLNPTSSKADIVLPAGTFAESDGTLVSNEGRAQRFYQVFVPGEEIHESWRWINDIMKTVGKSVVDSRQSWDDAINDIASTMSIFSPIRDMAPPAAFRIDNMKVPRQPHRYSGRTAMRANINVHEPKPPEDPDSPLSFSMEGHEDQTPPALTSRYWSPGWNSVQALNKFQQEIGGPLRGGDPGVRLINPPQSPFPKGGSNNIPPLTKGGQGGFFFTGIPGPSKLKPDEEIALLRYSIFGSEELSMHASGIVELACRVDLVTDQSAKSDTG